MNIHTSLDKFFIIFGDRFNKINHNICDGQHNSV